MPARQFISKLTPRGWMAVGGAAAVAIVFLVIVFQMASAPSYSTMLTGLQPAQTGKITAALDAKGIGYQIQNNGTALAVTTGQTAQAQIALATAGLLGTAQPGMELLNNQQLGASTFQQQITYQRALEGQLAQTIGQIQGVSGAQVQLVLPNPQDQLFSGAAQNATAAVLLSDSGTIDPGAVRGIAQLVASSVPNLPSSKVTITDSTGQLLWPTGETSPGGESSLLAKQQAQARYDSQMAAQVNAMLVSTLGPNKAQVQVNADLNTNQTTQDSLSYAKKGVPMTQSVDNETLAGTGTGTGGLAGTAGNISGAASTAAAGSKSNYKHVVTNTAFGISKTVGHTVITPGAINSQHVNVVFDKSVPVATQTAVSAAVAAAVGLNRKRGNAITTGTMSFVKAAVPTAAAAPSKMMTYAKYGLVGLGALLFLFFVTRMVRRREREGLMGEPTWLRELDVPRSLPALQRADGGAVMGAGDSPTQVIPTLQSPVNVARRQVEDLVDRDADRVAQQVRAWMSED
jgi:flagellar M-ring protein FliF